MDIVKLVSNIHKKTENTSIKNTCIFFDLKEFFEDNKNTDINDWSKNYLIHQEKTSTHVKFNCISLANELFKDVLKSREISLDEEEKEFFKTMLEVGKKAENEMLPEYLVSIKKDYGNYLIGRKFQGQCLKEGAKPPTYIKDGIDKAFSVATELSEENKMLKEALKAKAITETIPIEFIEAIALLNKGMEKIGEGKG